MVEALKVSINEINWFRIISSTDGPVLGKEPKKLFPQIVIIINLNNKDICIYW